MRLSQEAIAKTDLSHVIQFASNLSEFVGTNEHYRLLACLAAQIPTEATIIDIGTHRGDSALALSTGGQRIESFDIEDRIGKPAPLPNIRYNIADLWDPAVREKWRHELLRSALIFIDIDPHEGTREFELVEWLRANQYDGIIVLDDIRFFEGMRLNCWHKIDDRFKSDVTHLGHWAGTGIVSFREDFFGRD